MQFKDEVLRIVKFRRRDSGGTYENIAGQDHLISPTRVEFQTIPGFERQLSVSPSCATTFEDDTLTVDQAVDAIGFGMFQVKLSFFTGLIWMADAMEMMILSILAPALHCDWGLSSWQQAMLTTVVFAGMMISSSIWGKICDKYGRKVELILCSTFTLYYGLLSAIAPSYVWILILRGLVGVGIGGVPQSVTLYAEFLPSKSRARCLVMIELFWATGACFIVFISIFVMPTLGWRYLLFIGALPLFIFTLACLWLPESARFDIARGQPDKAAATLRRIARDNNKPMPLGRIIDTAPRSSKPVKRGQMRDLFTPELRVTTTLLWFIWLANAFSYYGVVLMTTELFETGDSCHGGSAENHAVEQACSATCKTLTNKDYTDLLWTTLSEFPGLFITFVIIEWFGRKKTIAIEFIVFSIFVFLLNLCTSRFVLTVFVFVARAFISGAFQAAYVYTPECRPVSPTVCVCSVVTQVYPTTTRALGLGSCSGMARVGAIVTPFVAQVMLRHSANMAVSIYGCVCILGAIASMLLPIETKGREMKDTHVVDGSRDTSRPMRPRLEIAFPYY
ncbi:Synaptic vesicle 2-related protein [Lamellibrachia satsuma]|nr:Synaptic vesicle 2-related protein [Lamellibrachia satsuma]